MMRVDQAIRRVNRDVALAWGIHLALAVGVVAAIGAGSVLSIHPLLLAAIPCVLWVVLAVNGVRETRAALEWPGLIASGKLDEAERQIERMIRGFGVLRSVKLMSLHQLAVLKLAQKRWGDALELSRAIMRYRFGKQQSLHRASLLVMAGAAVNAGAHDDAYAAMSALRRMDLTLDEQLSLLLAEISYCGRLGEWRAMMENVPAKLRLAELMPADLAAQVQAWLAIAAGRCGRADWAAYLAQRVALLVDVTRLKVDQPQFSELWESASTRQPTEG